MAKNPAAVALGRISTPKKAQAARENGKKGGRPDNLASLLALIADDSYAIQFQTLGQYRSALLTTAHLRGYAKKEKV